MEANNTAAMREALVELVYVIDMFDGGNPLWWHNNARGVSALKKARAALAAPLRNCDRFATVKDAAIAFARERQDAPSPCPDFTFSAWLLALAAERKGDNDEQK